VDGGRYRQTREASAETAHRSCDTPSESPKSCPHVFRKEAFSRQCLFEPMNGQESQCPLYQCVNWGCDGVGRPRPGGGSHEQRQRRGGGSPRLVRVAQNARGVVKGVVKGVTRASFGHRAPLMPQLKRGVSKASRRESFQGSLHHSAGGGCAP